MDNEYLETTLKEIVKHLTTIEMILIDKNIVSDAELEQYKSAADKIIDKRLSSNIKGV